MALTGILARSLQALQPLLKLPGQGGTPTLLDSAAPAAPVVELVELARASQHFIVAIRTSGVSNAAGTWTTAVTFSLSVVTSPAVVATALRERGWQTQDLNMFLLGLDTRVASGASSGFFVGIRELITPGDAQLNVFTNQVIRTTATDHIKVLRRYNALDPQGADPTLASIPLLFDVGINVHLHQPSSSWWSKVPVQNVIIRALDDGVGAFTADVTAWFLLSPRGSIPVG